MEQRLKRLRILLKEQQLDSIIVNKMENRRYLSGFTGSAGLLFVSAHEAKLLTDFRYVEQATQQAELYEVIRYGASPNSLDEIMKKMIDELGWHKIGFESDFLTYDTFNHWTKVLSTIELVPVQLDRLRMVKDLSEITLIKRAVAIADDAFTHILSFLKVGISEYDVALEIEYKMRQLGAEKVAFDTIVASGQRGALPHGKPSMDKLLENGDFVTMDFGAVYQGYHSDITRTVVMGQANEKQRAMYDLVLKAQIAGVEAVQPGRLGCAIDTVSRKMIEEAGFGEYFGHGLGHSLGLAIHEEPRLSPANANIALQENMLVTVEPGIYLPGWGGLRIEDTVLVDSVGAQILTASSKQLIEIN